jgi:hypothetical protein
MDPAEVARKLEEHARFLKEWEELIARTGKWKAKVLTSAYY